MSYCPEPSLDPPITWFDRYGDDVDDRMIELVWEMFDPEEADGQELLFDMIYNRENCKEVFIEKLDEMLCEDGVDWGEDDIITEYAITPHFKTWKETRGKELDWKEAIEKYYDEILLDENEYTDTFWEPYMSSLGLYVNKHKKGELADLFHSYVMKEKKDELFEKACEDIEWKYNNPY